MITLTAGISCVDLQFQGAPRVIATAVLHGPAGIALIDPGPASSLPVLRETLKRAGIGVADVTALLLTHIHLDHAGGCGVLLRENPKLKVFVHTKGASHMINPEKLLASASRLYGDAMDRLWGDVLPVPEGALMILQGGERIEAGGRSLRVEYTPGHASHHVSYFCQDAGIAFVGDTAGVKVVPEGAVWPPTPPPDIDLEAWSDSLSRIEGFGAETIFLTHFGPISPVGSHVSALRENLTNASRLAKESLARDGTDEEREAWFVDECRRALQHTMDENNARLYEAAGRFDLSWRGLARYWRKRAG
jgi:glyoxylase-like metal-dependent hydrolase (beta-lactamase superfamily II)